MRLTRHILLAVLLLGLSSCTSIREAQEVVAEADSLRAEGVLYADSAAMADAAATLERVRLIYPTPYAHANYYYGRILRKHGNQPEAMLAFLRVIHSCTKDNEIKARAYSNMGTMCNYADEFALSYKMYEQSAALFQKTNEPTLYYYAQNAKALQLAELGLRDETLALLDSIAYACPDSGVLTKTWETKAFLYMNLMQYDSALYSIKMLHAAGYYEPCSYVKEAQAYWYLQQYDSALYYAQYVLSLPQSSARDRYNMLYILTYNDSTLNEQQVRERSEERADIDKEILDPISTQHTQAIDLLRQDLARKPDFKWLLAILITLAIITIALTLYIARKRRKHQLISQQIRETQAAHQQLVVDEIELFCRTITDASSLQANLCWNDYNKMCEVVNNRMFGLADKLKALGFLNEREIRLCILVVIGKFRDKEMAELLLYGENSLRTIKTMVAKKLGTTSRHLRSFLLHLASKTNSNK